MPKHTHEFYGLMITKAAEDGDERIIEGVATTPTPDRAGDVVMPKGAQFKLPLPFLAGHDSGEPIGHVIDAKVSDAGIKVKIVVAKNTGLGYVEKAWLQIKSGLVRGLSIGFIPDFDSAVPVNPKSPYDGWIFKAWEWLELSAVTIPANRDGQMQTVKCIDAARSGRRASDQGRSASHSSERKGAAMPTIKERREAAEADLAKIIDDIETKSAILGDDDDANEPILADIAALGAKRVAKESAVEGLKAAELAMKGRVATPDDKPPAPRAPGLLTYGKSKSRDPADFFFKAATLAVLMKSEQKPLDQVMAERYSDDAEFIRFKNEGGLGSIIKTATAPATTTGSTWAANLVETQQGEFLDLLQPISAFGQLVALGNPLPPGTTKIPSRTADSNALRGAFVAEGQPIPVRIGSIGSQTLGPKKMGVITTWTQELLENSTPGIEALCRKFILDDTAVAIDTALVDSVAASTYRPAGLLNGVTPTGSATGAALANMIGDIKVLVSGFPGVQGGRRIVFLMNEAQALALAFATNAMGGFAFPDITQTGGSILGYPVIVTNSVAAATIIAVDAQSFVAMNGVPEFKVSEHATLHMEDGSYAANQTATAGTTTVRAPVAASMEAMRCMPWSMITASSPANAGS